MASVAHEAKRTPQWSDAIPEALDRALAEYEIDSKGEFEPLYSLASQVDIDGLSVHGEFSVVSDDCWIAPGTVYARLVYEPNSKDRTEFTDSFPIRVFYTVDHGKVTVSKVTVDVSSFNE